MSETLKNMGESIKETGHNAVQKTKEFFGAEKETVPGRMKDKAEDVKDWASEKKDDLKDFGERKKDDLVDYKNKVNREIRD